MLPKCTVPYFKGLYSMNSLSSFYALVKTQDYLAFEIVIYWLFEPTIIRGQVFGLIMFLDRFF